MESLIGLIFPTCLSKMNCYFHFPWHWNSQDQSGQGVFIPKILGVKLTQFMLLCTVYLSFYFCLILFLPINQLTSVNYFSSIIYSLPTSSHIVYLKSDTRHNVSSIDPETAEGGGRVVFPKMYLLKRGWNPGFLWLLKSAFFHFQHTLNRLLNSCIRLYWY